MSDPTSAASPPTAPAQAQPKTFAQKLTPWASGAVAVIFLLIGIIRLYNYFVPSLPSCTSSQTDSTIHDIFKSKDVNLTVLNDMKTVTDGKDERTCQAHIETPAEVGTIEYRIYWEGKNAQVQISKVDARPR